MRKIILAVSLTVLAGCAAPPPGTHKLFLIHGKQERCTDISDLDHALSVEDRAYFAGWTHQDFNDAENWSKQCIAYGWKFHGSMRVVFLRNFEKGLRAEEDQRKTQQDLVEGAIRQYGPGEVSFTCNNLLSLGETQYTSGLETRVFGARLIDWRQDTADYLKDKVDSCALHADPRGLHVEAIKAALDRLVRLAAEKRDAATAATSAMRLQKTLEVCQAQKQFQLYQAQESVISTIDQIAGWKRNQAEERRIVAASGVRDLGEERNNGEWIIQLSDDLKGYFADYKRLGGKAKSPNSVKHLLKDPCSEEK